MSDYLCITIRFLDGAFHGRADHGEPEWPPSPMRLYQAIVAASAARWNERRGLSHAEPALKWLEELPPPEIISPKTHEAVGYRLYVPDNAGDLVARSWSRGGDDSIANYRTEKSIRPMLFQAEGAVHYLWKVAELPEGFEQHREVIFEAVHSITHIGWGVDLVVATVSVLDEEAMTASGEKWRPSDEGGSKALRTPRKGTFEDLARRHQAFLNRVSGDGFSPVPPLSDFNVVYYRSDSQPPTVPYAVFALRKPDGNGFRAFDLARRSLHVAGMLRHAASQPDFLRSVGWSQDEARRIVLGHGEDPGQSHQAVDGLRLSFLPLPSIESRGQGKERVISSIRRVLITMRGQGSSDVLKRFIQRFEGQELIEENSREAVAYIQRQLNTTEPAIRDYLAESSAWATVTPVILPGYDDPKKLRQRLRQDNQPLTTDEKADVLKKLDQRIDSLLRKAIRQAGFSEELAAHAHLDWRASGFWPGTALVTQYAVPEQHRRYRRLHVRIVWRSPEGQAIQMPGPICIGSGKFTGMGLFAALPGIA